MPEDFFERASDQSRVKSEIVSKYFAAWATVILAQSRGNSAQIAYIDLFAGPGRYDDGTPSTPLMILQEAIGNDQLRDNLATIFNDVKPEYADALQAEIERLVGIESLKYKPSVQSVKVDLVLADQFKTMNLVPSFIFVDPWGYVGLSRVLLESVVKSWGCDVAFFFNYNRINTGISNDSVAEHMDVLFGKEDADNLRDAVSGIRGFKRERLIVEAIQQAVNDGGSRYTLTYRFLHSKQKRTSHYLIFVTKNETAHNIMKGIMARASSRSPQGVATFEFDPRADAMPMLPDFETPLDDLEHGLLQRYAGQTRTMLSVFRDHNVGTRYTSPNYKSALRNLEGRGAIAADPPSDKRQANSFGNPVKVTFPTA